RIQHGLEHARVWPDRCACPSAPRWCARARRLECTGVSGRDVKMTGYRRLVQRRSCALLLLILESGCATPLTPQGARVFVVRTPLNQSPPQQRMPAACSLVAATPTLSRTEFELEEIGRA